MANWPATEPDLLQRVEEQLAKELGLGADALFLDFPSKPDMFDVSIPGAESLGLPRVAAELHRSAQRLRVFVLEPAEIAARAIVELVTWPREEVAARLDSEKALLSAPGGVCCVVTFSCVGASTESMRTRIAVMLSSPPCRFASAISESTSSCGMRSGESSSASW